ncbi:hypothetical protein IW492_02565 [Enterococcus sp. BWB1-3]|uniref:hypothetical protein n=1 Tax=Enterococcus sp. BWB1-3 TaxID=2787713 RepID=UPI001921BAA3|nr:hypothetical protein [Enterococcus sp. BWB1-3]MBL1228114.1 hypothetical protein [Enterococcus sp. BWB1-3]
MNWLEKYKIDFEFKSYYEISQATGISKSSISSMKKANDWKKTQYENMTLLAKAVGLSLKEFDQYLREKENKMNTQELLETIKTKEVQFAIKNEKGQVLANRGTDNLQSIFGLKDTKHNHFYGVYGDSIRTADGQVDSREKTDEEILKSIERLLALGIPVDRNTLQDVEYFYEQYEA